MKEEEEEDKDDERWQEINVDGMQRQRRTGKIRKKKGEGFCLMVLTRKWNWRSMRKEKM